MKPAGTLLLTRGDVASLLDLDRCIAAVEEAFRLRGEGKAPPPGMFGFPAAGGGFHIKSAALSLSRRHPVRCRSDWPDLIRLAPSSWKSSLDRPAVPSPAPFQQRAHEPLHVRLKTFDPSFNPQGIVV